MLTIRESSWLTDNTYLYDEVVKMMAELLGTFHGDIQVHYNTVQKNLKELCSFSTVVALRETLRDFVPQSQRMSLGSETSNSIRNSCFVFKLFFLNQGFIRCCI